MESTKSAWIGAGAIILAAVISGFFAFYHSVPSKTNFSGEIRNAQGQPIGGARVLIAEDQQTPESTYSDENGVFDVVLINSVNTLKITVIATGYDTASRDVNPHRTGPEEFILQPHVSESREPKRHQPTQNSTKGESSPIVVGNGNNVATPKN